MENNKNLLPVAIVAFALIISAAIISRTGVYIKNTGGVESNGKISNTISVSGDGKVSAKPDMVEFYVSVNELAPTSRIALDRVSDKVKQITDILKDNGINEKDITTSGLNIHTEYDYSGTYRKITGQRATENLTVKVKGIDSKAAKATKIIDELSSVDKIELGGIRFDIEDKAAFFTQARELAFKKAEQKAQELAKLSKVKLAKPVSISDTSYDYAPMPVYSNVAEYKTRAVDQAASAPTIATGEMSISANLSILWGIE